MSTIPSPKTSIAKLVLYPKPKPFKVMVLGQSGVGKSALVVRFITRRYIGEYDPKLEKTYQFQTVIDKEMVCFEILDSAGETHESEYANLEHNIRWAEAFILVYSVTDKCSFDECHRLKFLINYNKRRRRFTSTKDNILETPVVMVGNKVDQAGDRMVTTDEGQRRSKEIGCVCFHEISVRESIEQLLVCSVSWVSNFLTGLCFGGPTVFVPQIRREANSTKVIDESMESLLMSIYSYATIPGVILLPILAAHFGRKIPYVCASAVFVIGATLFYTSSSVKMLLISEILESVLLSATFTITCMVMAECSIPRYRGFFLTFMSASFNFGIWLSNAIGTFFHWKNIGLVKVILSFYPLVVLVVCPESPHWFASQGKLAECAKSHRWLKGNSKKSEQELQRLIADKEQATENMSLKVIMHKEFFKFVLLGMCMWFVFIFSGKIACGFYALVIIKKMTSSESTAYKGMLILDGITVLAMFVGTTLSKYLKRRTLYFYSSCLGIGTLFILSLYVYLVNSTVLPENHYVSIVLLSVYSLGIGCGPSLMTSSLYCELLPLKSRSLAMVFICIPDVLVSGFVTQMTPIVIKECGLHVAYLCFGISSSIFIGLLFKYLPETKDKSIHEIEDSIKGV